MHRPWQTIVTLVAAMLAVVLVSGTSIAAIAVSSLKSQVHAVSLDPNVPVATPNKTAASFSGAANILIVGSDSRAGQSEAVNEGDPGTLNNDVTVLVHISADHQQMTAVSIPRDLITTLPSCRNTDSGAIEPAVRGQFNEALPRGGTQGGLACVARAVDQLLGVSPAYAGLLKFDGVAQMADAVGGVTVCVASPIHDSYVGLDLTAGEHLLKGRDASRFLRSRHGTLDGSDLSRISNQQVFLSALVRKVAAPGGALSNPLTMYRLARVATQNMTLSRSLEQLNTLVGLGTTLREMNLSDVLFVQYPVVEDPLNHNRVIANDQAAPALAAALQQDTHTNLNGDALGGDATVNGASASPSAASSAAATRRPSAGATSGSGGSGRGTSSTPTPTPSVASTPLPSGITGQSAAEQTCSKGGG